MGFYLLFLPFHLCFSFTCHNENPNAIKHYGICALTHNELMCAQFLSQIPDWDSVQKLYINKGRLAWPYKNEKIRFLKS